LKRKLVRGIVVGLLGRRIKQSKVAKRPAIEAPAGGGKVKV
jgi:hypothetical protein